MTSLIEALRAGASRANGQEAHQHICTPEGDEVCTMSTATYDVQLAFEMGVFPQEYVTVDCHRSAGCAPLTRLANLLPEE